MSSTNHVVVNPGTPFSRPGWAHSIMRNADTSLLYGFDRALFAEAKELKFGKHAKKTRSYSDISPSQFEKTFSFETERIYHEITEIISFYNRITSEKKGIRPLPVKEWQQAGRALYSRKPA